MQEILPEIPKIKYEGPDSDNPLSFRWYEPSRKVNGKTMAKHLRFSIAAWHSVGNGLRDIFGDETLTFPWKGEPQEKATEMRMQALAELAHKLQAPFVCFHGRDLFTEDPNYATQESNYHRQAKLLGSILSDYGIRLGWGTENLFSHPMYAQGSLNSPFPKVAARAAAEVKLMLDITNELRGENYVLWGGRVGYQSLLVTNMEREIANLGNLYRAIADYRGKNYPGIQLLEEPKPKEPQIHQYSHDAATTLNFLRAAGIIDAFKLNIEVNHAELAGKTFEHELTVARINGNKIGGVDANSGAEFAGWDVDRYMESYPDALLGWNQIHLQGGLGSGVINHDAKPRRESTSWREKVIGHVMAMDLFAKALLAVEEGRLDAIRQLRDAQYSSYDDTVLGTTISGKLTPSLDALVEEARSGPVGEIPSGRYQEVRSLFQRVLER